MGLRTGVWLVGARGSVATGVVAGAAVLAAGLADPDGCVTESEPLRRLPLPGFGELVFGGHDIVDVPLRKRVEQLVAGGVLPAGPTARIGPALDAADRELRPAGPAAAGAVQMRHADALTADLVSFRERNGLDTVVVVNLSSTEPPVETASLPTTPEELTHALERRADVLPQSSLYAYAALMADCAYVDFTPSTGIRLPALESLAAARGLPHAGRDGKTGETLVKSVLAPMFAQRALRVRSWSGTNLLGGGDGATLRDPEAARSKTRSKSQVVEGILGHDVEGETHIDDVPGLGEWKTAWDHIGFEGFLGVRMTMQFTWQGCDSALAAPLVLDLVRLMALACRSGASGPQTQFGFFFKDPVPAAATAPGGAHTPAEHGLDAQYRALLGWAESVGS
ncbi:inositol-3-phosphate synthase [Streptomyces sp. NBC_01363]|uniref:inositol-3-phosphate synthase n=1 Tax=Streptomyces sp. NBC_01363 TaxID=2903840 RepID=UPI00224F1ACC|nr:inositol-3-phosphate synthase [Streptomyces sp. NBC_01363]MCX4733326.1 inositol-3-phosphate synthase [Streptomyces sp. NBC_01363]